MLVLSRLARGAGFHEQCATACLVALGCREDMYLHPVGAVTAPRKGTTQANLGVDLKAVVSR